MTSGSGKGAAKARTRGWGLLVLGSPRACFRGQKRMVPRAGKANWELGGAAVPTGTRASLKGLEMNSGASQVQRKPGRPRF